MTAGDTLTRLAALAGQEVGVSSWREVDQAMIDGFAAITGDHQWIHVDADRAARESPFGRTIAHGLLVLSLLPSLALEVLDIEENAPAGIKLGLNYGFDRVRFTAPVPTGSHLRARVRLTDVEPLDDGAKVMLHLVVETTRGRTPVLVADWLLRLFDE